MPAHPFQHTYECPQAECDVVRGEIVTIPPASGNVTVTVVEWVGLCKTNH